MAADGWQSDPDLSDRPQDFVGMEFYELLRHFETMGKRFGRGGSASDEPARLGQIARLGFARGEVANVQMNQESGRTPQIRVNAIGLFGPEGPMPLHLTSWMLARASNRWYSDVALNATSDTSFLDFANLLQHRMIAYYWRAWADNRPEVQMPHDNGGPVAAMLRALAGIGLHPPDPDAPVRTSAKLRHATSLFQRVRSPGRLKEYLGTVTGEAVTVREFIGVWTDIPEDLQSRLGQPTARLGTSAMVGGRFFERGRRAELRIGPLSLERFNLYLSDSSEQRALAHAIDFAMGRDIAFDVRLELELGDVPEPRLGDMRLGQVSWLGKPKSRKADDLVIQDLVDRPQGELAA